MTCVRQALCRWCESWQTPSCVRIFALRKWWMRARSALKALRAERSHAVPEALTHMRSRPNSSGSSFRDVKGRETGAGDAPAVKTFGKCPEALSLLGPFSQSETPHLDENQSFKNTQRCQQHVHQLLVSHMSHILFSSNSVARQRGDFAIPIPLGRCSSQLPWWHPIMYR